MKVIQLRGTNAVGKTTAIRQFVNRGNFCVKSFVMNGIEVEYHKDDERGIVVLGRYDQNVTGGIDGRITNKNVLRDAILKALSVEKPNVLLFEGIVYGVTFKFAYELFKVLKLRGCDYLGVCLEPPLDVSFERLSERNGGKPIDAMSVQQKWFTAQRAYEMLKEAGVPVVFVDSSKIPKDKMYKIIEDVL